LRQHSWLLLLREDNAESILNQSLMHRGQPPL
jgi:hypothetical protein